MAEQRVSRQELIRRRRRGGFVGRRAELAAFRENLDRDPAEEAYQFLFHVRGNAGVGKTSLLRQLEAVARERDAVTAYLDDDVHSAVEAMAAISAQCERQGRPLKRFDRLLATYRQRRHEAESAPVGQSDGEPSVAGTLAAQVGLAGLGAVPVVGALAGAVDPQQVALGADRLRGLLSARLRSHDDVQLVLTPVPLLTPVFLADLTELARQRPWVVLFFDTYERTAPVLDGWLRELLVDGGHGELPLNVLVVLAGQRRLDPGVWAGALDLVAELPLEVFTETEARQLLTARGITDERVTGTVLRLAGGLPVLLDTLAQARPSGPEAVQDPSGTAVERFLRWEGDPQRRAAALACALPLQLDQDVYGVLAEGDHYAWLRALPFVNEQAGKARYHDVVRTSMLRLQRTRSPQGWREQHTALAEAFGRWRSALERDLPRDGRWEDGAWLEYRLSETYHRLCANPHQALPGALVELVEACASGDSACRRAARTVVQAARDTEAEPLGPWGELLAGLDDSPELTVLTLLLTQPGLPAEHRAACFLARADRHQLGGDHPAAAGDCSAALALDPESVRAFATRARSRQALKQQPEALADCDRAVELAPEQGALLVQRGRLLRTMGRFEDALRDLDRAVALDPSDWHHRAERGEAYRLVDRPAEALAELTRATELNGAEAWPLASRGWVLHQLGRGEEALADLDRSLDLDPHQPWALTRRAELHRRAGRFDAALTDLDLAVALSPTWQWVVAERGETHRVMGRHPQALADFSRAIELSPAYAWALVRRGQTHELLGQHREAAADFTEALRIDRDLTERMLTSAHRQLGSFRVQLGTGRAGGLPGA
ncbi:tetratricopeptide (TPR) repeat protein [Kitasatospora gansuensis]|uniref:Tetratricopeptide (TPR) repeat protein n=1 Tax=Kitasatospora gansuensis TaxID=258050 RepID=A0A7W7SCZ8_9ACTN|nr:tetratricopeptide repeat protein [Kitasatospora gansuensis]MBB4947618.1 tetratricopeptide (TPR) repeat protein [Kitasatospora gansuensis]